MAGKLYSEMTPQEKHDFNVKMRQDAVDNASLAITDIRASRDRDFAEIEAARADGAPEAEILERKKRAEHFYSEELIGAEHTLLIAQQKLWAAKIAPIH